MQAAAKAEEEWDAETDLLVFGGGAGGLSASLFGAKAALRVLLCEKISQLGGTTGTSGGVVWIPGSAQARRRESTTRSSARANIKTGSSRK